MHSHLQKEKCELCQKFIYTHDVALVCNNDYKIYHAKCLKIDRDVALEIQNSSDWYCPCCLKSMFPLFDTDNDTSEPVKCLPVRNSSAIKKIE